MFADKARYVLYINSILFLFLFTVIGILRAEDDSDGNKTSSQIHKDAVLMPGPNGKELIEGIVGIPEKGKTIYKKYCVFCHGKKGRGDGMAAIGLTPSPADLSKTFVAQQLDKKQSAEMQQRLFDIITYGRKGSRQIRMPAWGPVLSKQDRANVLAYLTTMFAK